MIISFTNNLTNFATINEKKLYFTIPVLVQLCGYIIIQKCRTDGTVDQQDLNESLDCLISYRSHSTFKIIKSLDASMLAFTTLGKNQTIYYILMSS